MKYTWLLFDADDTLFDFHKSQGSALQQTLEECGLPFSPEFHGLFAEFNNQVWREFERGEINHFALRLKRFRLFFDETRLNGDPQTISPLYLRNLSQGSHLFDGAEEVIRTLKKSHRLALVTNGVKEVQRPRLAKSAIADCFEQIFVSDEMGAAKPSRAYFDAVFDGIGQPPRDAALIIGDNLNTDMQGGLDYGIHTCWYNPGGLVSDLPVTYTIADLKELIDLLD